MTNRPQMTKECFMIGKVTHAKVVTKYRDYVREDDKHLLAAAYRGLLETQGFIDSLDMLRIFMGYEKTLSERKARAEAV
ncbi:hypothetical protein HGG70_05225 [Rhodobacteraceae bacterium R_SAG4]|nr:hypothetical protein [Rhodobacteraceae bacterium R_SAG4]